MTENWGASATRELTADDPTACSADHLTTALNAAALGTWDYDLASTDVYCSARCKQILGLPPQGNATPEGLLEGVNAADFAKVQRAYTAAVNPDGTGDILIEFRVNGLQDGRERWVRVKGRTFFDKGLPVRMAGAVEEITALKRVELERNRDFLFSQALARNIGEGVYTLDKAGHVTFLNNVAERLLGWSETELLGRDIHETIHFQRADGTPHPREECPLMAVLDSGTTVRGDDDVFTCKGGTLLPVSYSSSPILDGGETIGAVVAFRDISDIKTAQRETETLLAGERAARTHAEQAASAAAHSLHVATHDLRTPLNGILGWAQLLLEQATEPGDLRDGLLAITRAVAVQNDLLTRLSGPPSPRQAAQDAVTPEGRPIAASIAGLRVLVVDDDNDARNLIKRMLEGCDVLVLTAKSAEEALRLVEQARPDVLVSDISMPVVDGYTLLRQVRALGKDRGGNVPAIAVTAFARSEDRTRALLAGYRVHIPKPLDAAELVTTIASLAGRL